MDCDICDANKCLKCSGGYYYDTINNLCVYYCPKGYFRTGLICSKCPSNCDICQNESICINCSVGYLRYQNSCVSSCAVGFPSFDNQICVSQYESNCLNLGELCSQCEASYFLQSNTCQASCQDGWYLDTVDNNCKVCSDPKCLYCKQDSCELCDYGYYISGPNCIICSQDLPNCEYCTLSTKCYKCANGFYLENYKCVSTCTKGFPNSKNLECQPCAQTYCDTCSDQSYYSCTLCALTYTLNSEGLCVKTCTAAQSYSKNQGGCVNCSTSCATCIGFNVCSTCSDITKVYYNGQCAATCPQYSVNTLPLQCSSCYQSKCIKCASPIQGNCQECASPDYQLVPGGICIKSCLDGEYLNYNKCDMCTQATKCKICTPESNGSNCTQCLSNFYLLNQICYDTCPEGYVNDASNMSCKKCLINNCSQCALLSINQCSACKSGLFMTEDYLNCLDTCPSGYVEDTLNKLCKKCSTINCQKCSISTLNICNDCIVGYFKQEGNCVLTCSVGYVEDLQNRSCLKCSTLNCKSCKLQSLNTCTQCLDSFYLETDTLNCVSSCQQGYTQDISNKICIKCKDPSCSICSLDGSCQKCTNQKLLYNGSCINSCPQYHVVNDQQQCIKCGIDNCIDCPFDNLNVCKKCNTNFFLQNANQCVSSCSDGYYGGIIDLIATCVKCQIPNCQKCTTSDTCSQCYASSYLLENSSCVTQCPTSYEESPQRICLKCQVNNCLFCSYRNVNECTKCISPYLLLKGNSCVTECPRGYILNSDTCQEKSPVKYTIVASLLDKSDYSFNILLDEEIVEPIQSKESCIQINIPKLTSGLSISSKVQFTQSKSYSVIFSITLKNFIVQDVNVEISISSSCYPLFDQKPQVVILKIEPELSEGEKQITSVIKESSEISKSIAGNSFFPLAAFGNLRYLASLFDISQLINMMIFVNISIPQNLVALFDSLEEFQIPFKNMFTFMANYDQIEYPLEGKFESQGKNGFFLDNAGDTISMFLVLMVIRLVIVSVKYMLRGFNRALYRIKQLDEFLFSDSGMYDIVDMSYNQLSFATFLQMISFTKAKYLVEYMNYFSLILTINIILLPLLIAFQFKQNKLQGIRNHIDKNYNCVGYPFLLFFRKFFFALTFGFLQKSGLVQLVLLSIFHLFQMVFIGKYKPLKKKHLNIKEFFQSFLFLTASAFMIPLVYAEYLTIRLCYNLGWVILVSLLLIIVIDGLYFIYECSRFVIEKLKALRDYLKNRKQIKQLDKQEKKRLSKQIQQSIQIKEAPDNDQELNNPINSGDIVIEKFNGNELKSDNFFSPNYGSTRYLNINDQSSQHNIFISKKPISTDLIQQSSLALPSFRDSPNTSNQLYIIDKQYQKSIHKKKVSSDLTTINNDIELSGYKIN